MTLHDETVAPRVLEMAPFDGRQLRERIRIDGQLVRESLAAPPAPAVGERCRALALDDGDVGGATLRRATTSPGQRLDALRRHVGEPFEVEHPRGARRRSIPQNHPRTFDRRR